jgi:hypothetical protein
MRNIQTVKQQQPLTLLPPPTPDSKHYLHLWHLNELSNESCIIPAEMDTAKTDAINPSALNIFANVTANSYLSFSDI